MAALFERTNRHLYYYAYMLTGDPADAEDLLQEGFIKCILSLDTLQNPNAFYTWMWTVLRNLHTNNVRKNKYQVISQEEPDFEEKRMLSVILSKEDTPEMQAEKKELAGILRHMIHALPSEQKKVILLHYYDDLLLAEIAKIQGCPLATVKSRLLYAKKSLRTAIRLEEEKSGVALHATFLIPVYPAILARLASLVTMSWDAVFSVFMSVHECCRLLWRCLLRRYGTAPWHDRHGRSSHSRPRIRDPCPCRTDCGCRDGIVSGDRLWRRQNVCKRRRGTGGGHVGIGNLHNRVGV